MSKMIITVNGQAFDVDIEVLEEDGMEMVPFQNTTQSNYTSVAKSPTAAPAARPKAKKQTAVSMDGNILKSPINGVVLEVPVKPGTQVKEGDVVIILEAMKMKTNIYAPEAATVSEIMVRNGDNVETGQSLVAFE